MNRLLWLGLLRHLGRHRWQLALAVLGIALGVAVVLAVDLANESARRSFELASEQLSGRTTHRIVASERGLDEALYPRLRIEVGIRPIAPVVSGTLEAVDPSGKTVQLLGVDPFAEAPFRGYTGQQESTDVDLPALLTEPATALLPPDVPGERLRLRVGNGERSLRAVGRLHGAGLEGLVVVDIATAQELLGMHGRLSHIDVRLPEGAAGEALAARIREHLPPGTELVDAVERDRATAELSASFGLNLTAMSLLALLVGLFLIYNTLSFAVVQRRALIGMLRALGVTRREIVTVILGEALLLGLVGTALGLILGIWLGSGLVQLVTRTVDDLYYTLTVTRFELPPLTLLKAVLLGLAASVAAALLPAREAAGSPPGVVLSRAGLEARWRAVLPRLCLAGAALWLLGGLLLWGSRGLIGGFAGLFALILGCALFCPPLLAGSLKLLARLPLGLIGQMAVRGVVRHLSRTGIAAAALMVAFSATVGVGVMVDSFRSGVIVWLDDLLTAEFYIAPVRQGGSERVLQAEVLEHLRGLDGVESVATARWRDVWLRGRPTDLSAMALPPAARAGYRFLDADPAVAWRGFDAGSVLISEPLAYRHGLSRGDSITLRTDSGPAGFPIAGIFYDYGSEHGRILIADPIYRRHWSDEAIGSAAVFAAAGIEYDALRRMLEQQLGPLQPLQIRSDGDIHALTLEVFDRTFTITGVLRLLAIAVACVGMVGALLAQLLERTREFSVLRALGMTPRGLGGLLTVQTGLLGALAGVLAVPVGLLLAAVLIFVINRRAFGWTLPFEVDPLLLFEAVLLAVMAALLAVLVPLWRLRRLAPAEGLRAE